MTFWPKIQSGAILHDIMDAIKPKQDAAAIAGPVSLSLSSIAVSALTSVTKGEVVDTYANGR